MEDYIICTHRLQPLHFGHVRFWLAIREKFKDRHLIICILRRSRHLQYLREGLKNPETFEEFGRLAFAIDRNPLPNWQRLRLACLATAAEPLLRTTSTVILRNRTDISWEASIEDLPENRVWAFNVGAEPEFSRAKSEFYESREEDVVMLDVSRGEGQNAFEIRTALRAGDDDLSFLPQACRSYFLDECQEYFQT